MLVRDFEAAVLPRKHFDKARSLVGIAPLQRHSGMLVDQAESLQGGPVTPEQPDEVFLASGLPDRCRRRRNRWISAWSDS